MKISNLIILIILNSLCFISISIVFFYYYRGLITKNDNLQLINKKINRKKRKTKAALTYSLKKINFCCFLLLLLIILLLLSLFIFSRARLIILQKNIFLISSNLSDLNYLIQEGEETRAQTDIDEKE